MQGKIIVKGVPGGLFVPAKVKKTFEIFRSNRRQDTPPLTSPALVTSRSCMKSASCILRRCAALNTAGNGAKGSEGVGALVKSTLPMSRLFAHYSCRERFN